MWLENLWIPVMKITMRRAHYCELQADVFRPGYLYLELRPI
jgi:hypothetical protein